MKPDYNKLTSIMNSCNTEAQYFTFIDWIDRLELSDHMIKFYQRLVQVKLDDLYQELKQGEQNVS